MYSSIMITIRDKKAGESLFQILLVIPPLFPRQNSYPCLNQAEESMALPVSHARPPQAAARGTAIHTIAVPLRNPINTGAHQGTFADDCPDAVYFGIESGRAPGDGGFRIPLADVPATPPSCARASLSIAEKIPAAGDCGSGG